MKIHFLYYIYENPFLILYNKSNDLFINSQYIENILYAYAYNRKKINNYVHKQEIINW